MAENDVSQWIPSVTDDYMAGKVTFTANSKDITFKDAFNGAEKSYTAGDSIYIPTEGRWLLLKEITSTTKGSLLYPCPESCAGTFDLLIRPLARNARQAGLATMTLRNLNVGNLPGLANAKLKTGQILVASQIAGSFDAIDLNADNIAETDNRKIMTADEREKVRKLKADLTAADIAETDARKIMTADERNKIASIIGLALNDWTAGTSSTEALISPQKLAKTIKNSFGGALDNGWVKLSNGLLIQWGLKQSENSSYGQIFYPTTFTQKCFFYPVLLQAWTSEGFAPIVYGDWGDNLNLFSHGFHCRQMNGTSGVTDLNTWNIAWLAIGY